MTGITNLGVGSGLDLTSLLSTLSTAENVPLSTISTSAVAYKTKLTDYGMIASAVSSFQNAATALGSANLYRSVGATSSSTTVLNATATTAATAGTYSVNVTRLATAQSLASGGVASTTNPIGTGTVTLTFGTISGGTLDPATGKYSGATFTADSTQTPGTLTIDATNNTLPGIRDAINAKTGTLGVTASIVNDGGASPYRLVLTSTSTGATQSMQISVSETDGGSGLSNLLSQDPAGTQNLTQTAAAGNADLTVNGLAITSKTNTVQEAIQGVTMTLGATGTTSVTTKTDTSAISTSVDTFVAAYNTLQSTISSLTSYNVATSTAGALSGDYTTQSILSRIRGMLNTSFSTASTGGMGMLNQLGVSFTLSGTLSVNSTTLSNSLRSNLAGVSALMTGYDLSTTLPSSSYSTITNTSGLGNQLSGLLSTMTAPSGMLSTATAGISSSLVRLSTQYSTTELQISATIARYKAQFTSLDTLMATLSSTSSYLTGQFDALNAKTN